MYKNSENGAKLPISRKSRGWEKARGHRTGGTVFARSPALGGTTSARANRVHARWPVVPFWQTAPGQRAWDNSGDL